jgi:quinoprotein glucose dehydrogenase
VQLDVYEAVKKRPNLAAKTQQWKASLPKNDDLANYRLSLAGGDAERGKKIFREHPTEQCFKCHKCEGGDSMVGPELTKIGAQKGRADLLEAIVFPNKTIAQGFQIVVLELSDGATVAGRLLGEANGTLQVETVDGQGKPQNVNVPAAKIKKRVSAPSPMPETIRDTLTRAELRDVVEYLATRK